MLDLAVTHMASSDSNLRVVAGSLVCARVYLTASPPDAVVRALEMSLRTTSDLRAKLFIVEFLCERADQVSPKLRFCKRFMDHVPVVLRWPVSPKRHISM